MSEFFSVLIAILTDLPDLIRFYNAFMEWKKRSSGQDVAGFMGKMADAAVALNNAQTDEEEKDALKKTQDLLAGKQ